MTLNEYQELAKRTSNPALTPFEQIDNGSDGLCGEAGEVKDIIKKIKYQGHPFDEAAREKLIDEISDVLWYAAQAATGLGIALEYIAQHNVDKLKRRYPDGFSAERSVNREA